MQRSTSRAPSREGAGEQVEDLAIGLRHVCARMRDGAVRCYGSNQCGSLGDGTLTARPLPVAVAGVDHVVALEVDPGAATGPHTCAVRSDGTAWCWGCNHHGMLGEGTTDDFPVPHRVPGLDRVTQVATGMGGTACARRADGTVRCWGGDPDGLPSPWARPRPEDARGVAEVVLGDTVHGCARRMDGTIRCMAFGRDMGVTGAVSLVTAATHACSVLRDGTVRCWGSDDAFQLGVVAARSAPIGPVFQPPVRDVIQVAAGFSHTCALRADRTVQCWGGNQHGQLGDGTFGSRATPATVEGLTDVVRIAAGGFMTCAIRSNGEVLCWGQGLPGDLRRDYVWPYAVPWRLRASWE